MNFTLLRYDTVGSTNDEAADHARRGAAEGLCIIARQQTAGRGRQGRKWVSDKDAGLYLSVVLRPEFDRAMLPLITLTAGVAVYDALTGFGLNPDIKWVNDILVHEKKISGILAEAIDTPLGPAVIVGIGINLMAGVSEGELADTATSVEAETGRTVTPDEAAASVNRYLSRHYEILKGEDGPARLVDEWARRSSYFHGKSVRASVGDGFVDGVTEGLENNGALRIRTGDGVITVIQAGDVQSLRTHSDP